MREVSWLAENELASQEGLCSIEEVSNASYDDEEHNEYFKFVMH